MSERRMLALWTATACWLLSGCALVTPLAELRKEQHDGGRCTGARCPGDPSPPLTEMGARDASDFSEASVPLNDAALSCDVPPGAECNPLTGCPCEPGTECGLDEQQLVVRCVPKHTGTKLDGEHCASSTDCASGLSCDGVNLCARFCAGDEDCAGSGKCRPHEDARTRTSIPAASTCSRWCDLWSASECTEESSCYPSGLDAEDPHARCGSFHDSTRKARGEACAWYNECDRLLMCAQFGPSVCTSMCKTDADCSAQAPHCYRELVQPLAAADAVRVGQCVVWPCDSTTIGEPRPWTAGPVWSAEQSAECSKRCGRFNADCYQKNCADGERWRTCWNTALAACAAARSGACREQYVAFTCSDIARREPPRIALETCLEQQSNCSARAVSTCAETASSEP